jgi:hypothetical protein
MTSTLLKKCLFTAAVTVIAAAVNPGTMFAQTSGVGSDGYTRILWRGTDGEISLWKLDGNLNYVGSHAYGPYDGWIPLAITVGQDNYARVLWKNTQGAISLWNVDPNLNLAYSRVYGPYYGWVPESISIDDNNNSRVSWRETQGHVSVWYVDPALNYLFSRVYGPYFGWDPGAAAAKKHAPAPKDTPAEMSRPKDKPAPE